MITPVKLNKERGDTIVEVLIVLVIVSAVLVGAFAVSQKSAMAVRDGQERGEVLQLLQGQIEIVRSVAIKEPNNSTGVYSVSPQYFCMRQSDGTRVDQPGLVLGNLVTYHAECKNLGNGGHYSVAIRYNPGASDKFFTFYGFWDGPDGGQRRAQLTYRVHPQN